MSSLGGKWRTSGVVNVGAKLRVWPWRVPEVRDTITMDVIVMFNMLLRMVVSLIEKVFSVTLTRSGY